MRLELFLFVLNFASLFLLSFLFFRFRQIHPKNHVFLPYKTAVQSFRHILCFQVTFFFKLIYWLYRLIKNQIKKEKKNEKFHLQPQYCSYFILIFGLFSASLFLQNCSYNKKRVFMEGPDVCWQRNSSLAYICNYYI